MDYYQLQMTERGITKLVFFWLPVGLISSACLPFAVHLCSASFVHFFNSLYLVSITSVFCVYVRVVTILIHISSANDM